MKSSSMKSMIVVLLISHVQKEQMQHYIVNSASLSSQHRPKIGTDCLSVEIIGSPYRGPLVPPYDVYSYFGLICENGSWYATKYPIGIQYYIDRRNTTALGSAEEYVDQEGVIGGFFKKKMYGFKVFIDFV
ncbi:hypothetical protein CAEBREN_32020 [Caenorhabditis brenneri]|uniref:Uncharacterized protein n=1 Tax=Caenorhabditis brenneri TaxID=135651 RepID=G0PCI4_CAEBE|nr:hypothetical protein CAEBREN_32020 [Caenorhabditis brenneri]